MKDVSGEGATRFGKRADAPHQRRPSPEDYKTEGIPGQAALGASSLCTGRRRRRTSSGRCHEAGQPETGSFGHDLSLLNRFEQEGAVRLRHARPRF